MSFSLLTTLEDGVISKKVVGRQPFTKMNTICIALHTWREDNGEETR